MTSSCSAPGRTIFRVVRARSRAPPPPPARVSSPPPPPTPPFFKGVGPPPRPPPPKRARAHPRHGLRMAGLVLQNMAVSLGRHGDVAGFQRFGRNRQHFGG